MWLNCKVIKKWQPPISTLTPSFQVYLPFLAKNFEPPQVTQFLEGPNHPPPSFNKEGVGGGQFQLWEVTFNINKAPGHDDISIQMIKLCSKSVVKPLSIIFKNCIDTGTFPDNQT